MPATQKRRIKKRLKGKPSLRDLAVSAKKAVTSPLKNRGGTNTNTAKLLKQLSVSEKNN